jgi:hypothetical protein
VEERPPEAYRWQMALADKAWSFGAGWRSRRRPGSWPCSAWTPPRTAARRAAHAALAMVRAAGRAGDAGSGPSRLAIAIHVDRALVGGAGAAAVLDADAKLAAWRVLEGLLARGRPEGILATEAAAPFLERGFDLEPVAADAGTPLVGYRVRGVERTGYGLAGPRHPPGVEGRRARPLRRHHDLPGERLRRVRARQRREPLDFVQLNYSLGEREAERRLLPLVRHRGLAALVNRPFAGGGLFPRVRGRPLPPWAAELGVASWAQFALKWILGHPAVTCVIPATSRPAHLADNMGAAVGPLPDPAARARMATAFDAL